MRITPSLGLVIVNKNVGGFVFWEAFWPSGKKLASKPIYPRMGGLCLHLSFSNSMRFAWALIIIIILFKQKEPWHIENVNNSRQDFSSKEEIEYQRRI